MLALGPGDLFWQVFPSSEHCGSILQLLFILLVVLFSFNKFYPLWDQQHQPYSYFDSEHTANIGSGFHCTENSLEQQLLFIRFICSLGKEELPVITIFYFSAQLWDFMDISTTLPPPDLGSDTDLSLPNMTVVCVTWFHDAYAMIWMPV